MSAAAVNAIAAGRVQLKISRIFTLTGFKCRFDNAMRQPKFQAGNQLSR